jgi:PKD repeat protein
MTHIEFITEEGDGWSAPVIIEGTDEWFDSDPAIEPLGDGWVVAWERTATENTGSRALAYAVVDATGSVQRSETIDNASQLALATDNDAVALGYHDHDTHQIRRDLITESNRTQDVAYDVNDERSVGELAVSASGTVWTAADQTATVGFYGEDGTVEQLDFVTAESRPQALTLVETTVGTIVGYTRIPGDDIRARELTYHVRVNGEWRPAQVPATTDASEDVTVREPAVAPTTDGEGLLTLLGAKVHDPDAVHDLFAVEQPFRPSYATTADTEQGTVAPGEEMTVSYTIENTGDLDGDAIGDDPVLVEARSQGQTLADQQESPLARGATATGELTFTVDETGTVDIVVGRELDLLDPEERRTTIEGSTPLLGVDSVAVERPDEGTAVGTIQLRNSGPVDAADFGIEVYASGDTLLGAAQVDGPAAGERSSATVEFDPSELALTRGEQVHIDPDEQLPESHVTQRVSSVLLGQPEVTVAEEIEYSETGSGAVATLELTNAGPVPTSVVVRAVWADATPEDGSFADEDLLGTVEVDLPAAIDGTAQTTDVAVTLSGAGYGDEVRFIVESDRPVVGAGVPVVYDRVGPFEGIPALPGYENPPRDLDGDGLYEDIDGSGEFDIFDVQALFNTLTSDAVQNNPEAFTFSDDSDSDEVTILDVQGLFDDLANPD